MLFRKRRIPIIKNPVVGILNLVGDDVADIVESDATFLGNLFALRRLSLTDTRSDILFVYAGLTPDGRIGGISQGLREIIRDSGAAVVVVATGNNASAYQKTLPKRHYGQANIVMTLDRKGTAFGTFFTALFAKMKAGTSMPVAWVELAPQAGRAPVHDNLPATIFACERGQLAFGDRG